MNIQDQESNNVSYHNFYLHINFAYGLPLIQAGGTSRDVQDSLIPSSAGRKARRISWDHSAPSAI